MWRFNEYSGRIDLAKEHTKRYFNGVPKAPSGCFQDVNGKLTAHNWQK